MRTLRAEYDGLRMWRSPYLDIARRTSELTIPSMFPITTTSDVNPPKHTNITLKYPYNSIGAGGVSNLSSKLIMLILPPNDVFFKFTPSEKELRKVFTDPQQFANVKREFDSRLSVIEKIVQRHIETSQIRNKLNEYIAQLIVAGNSSLEFKLDSYTKQTFLKVYKLNSYVVLRDGDDNIIKFITRTNITFGTLDAELRQKIIEQRLLDKQELPDEDEALDLYSGVYKDNGQKERDNDADIDNVDLSGNGYTYFQEVDGVIIPDSIVHYKHWNEVPFIVGRWRHVDGEDYGRGLCEDYLGDLSTLNEFTKCMIDSGFQSSRSYIGVRANGLIDVDVLQDAPNGSFIPCNDPKEDIVPIQFAKGGDLQTQQVNIQQIEQRLQYAFLLNSAVQRDAERVTAEEIRFMAQELESAHAGMYAQLSHETQLPLVRLVLRAMEKEKDIPELPHGTVDILITTGIDALGRGNDYQKLVQFVQTVAQTFPQALQYIIPSDYMKRLGAALSIDTMGLLMTDEQVQQAQQQAQMQAMAQQVAPHVAKGVMAQQQQAQQSQQE